MKCTEIEQSLILIQIRPSQSNDHKRKQLVLNSNV